jgi:hypothetical protein
VIKPLLSSQIGVKPTTIGGRTALLESLTKIQPNQRKRFIDAKYRGTTIEMPRVLIPPKRLENPPPHTEELVSESYDLQGIAVLAYLCKRVPKAPNPDTTLSWTE